MGICEANSNPLPKKNSGRDNNRSVSADNKGNHKAEKVDKDKGQLKTQSTPIMDKFKDFPEWEGMIFSQI